MDVNVRFDEGARMWALTTMINGVRDTTFWSTEELAWEHAGMPKPPGRMPVTDKDWE